jgi:hypothetical protein
VAEACKSCQREISSTAKTCPNCGAGSPTKGVYIQSKLSQMTWCVGAATLGACLAWSYMASQVPAPMGIVAAALVVGGVGLFFTNLLKIAWAAGSWPRSTS